MNRPFLYEEDVPLQWSLKDLYEFLRLLEQLGVSQEFFFVASAAEAHIQAPPETVNFLKNFLFERGLHKQSQYARSVVTSAHCPKRPDPPDPPKPPKDPKDPPKDPPEDPPKNQ